MPNETKALEDLPSAVRDVLLMNQEAQSKNNKLLSFIQEKSITYGGIDNETKAVNSIAGKYRLSL
jgi:hypothetical protein